MTTNFDDDDGDGDGDDGGVGDDDGDVCLVGVRVSLLTLSVAPTYPHRTGGCCHHHHHYHYHHHLHRSPHRHHYHHHRHHGSGNMFSRQGNVSWGIRNPHSESIPLVFISKKIMLCSIYFCLLVIFRKCMFGYILIIKMISRETVSITIDICRLNVTFVMVKVTCI